MPHRGLCLVAVMSLALAFAAQAQTALTNAFTYQGELWASGAPATGTFDLSFTLFNDTVAVAGPICADNVAVTNGRFTVQLDFGAAFVGQRRYVQISVRQDAAVGNCSAPAGYTVLSPRQELTAQPFALSALNAANSVQLNGQAATFYTNAGNLTGTLADARLTANVPRLGSPQTFTGTNTFSSTTNVFNGSGAGLTALNASNVTTGTLADARLSANIARLDAAQTWTGSQALTNVTNTISGNGAGLNSLNASNISSGTLSLLRLPSNVLVNNISNNVTADYRFSALGLGIAADPTAELRIASARSNGILATNPGTTSNTSAIRGEATGASGSTYGGYFSSASPGGAGVRGINSFGTGVFGSTSAAFSAGVYGSSATEAAYGVQGISFAASGAGTGVRGETFAPSGTAVYGQANDTAGTNYGVWGVSSSPSGVGVNAANPSVNGTALSAFAFASTGAGRGALARTNAESGIGLEARNDSTSTTGVPIALRAAINSAATGNGWAGYFIGPVYFDSNLLVGFGRPQAMVHVSHATGFHSQPFRVDIDGQEVVSINPNGRMGVNTTNPNAQLGINADTGSNPLRVQVNNATKLLVRENGGTVIGGLTGTPPDDGLLVNRRINVRDSDPNRQTDLWLGPDYDFEYAHLVVNGDGLQDLLALSNQDSTKFRVNADGSTAIGSNTVAPAQGLYVQGNTVIGPAGSPGVSDRLYVTGNAKVSIDLAVQDDVSISDNLVVAGSIAKGGGSFKIDHPLDPTNKYLYHSFVESPDMMNIYNGNVVTDAEGFATVTLPDWFDVLNRDFRYQLTVIDSGDDDFVFARVYRKLQDNRFVIKTSRPATEVSWQITGIRQDAWAQKNRIPVEQDKSPEHKGKYLHPEAFGQPVEKAVYPKSTSDEK